MVRYKDTDDPKEWVKRADEALSSHDSKTAIFCLKKAIIRDPQNADILKRLATVFAQYGYGSNAISTMKRVTKLRQVSFDVWYTLALLLAQKGEDVSALTAMREASRINPDCGKEWYQISVHIEETGDPGRAEVARKEAFKLGYTSRPKPPFQQKDRSAAEPQPLPRLSVKPMSSLEETRVISLPKPPLGEHIEELVIRKKPEIAASRHLKDRITSLSDVITKSILRPMEMKRLKRNLEDGEYDDIENRMSQRMWTSYARGSMIHVVRMDYYRAEGAKKVALLELLRRLEEIILDDVRETAARTVYDLMNIPIGNPKYSGREGSLFRVPAIAATLIKKYTTQDPLSSIKAFISLSRERAPSVDDKRVVLGTIAGLLRDVRGLDPETPRERKLQYEDLAATESMNAQGILDEDWTEAMKKATEKVIEDSIGFRIRREDKEELLRLYLNSFVRAEKGRLGYSAEWFLEKSMNASKLGTSKLRRIIVESSLSDSEREMCEKLLLDE